MKKYIASALILCASLPAFSQARIDKEIERMEKMTNVETLYTEKRSPKKKKCLVISRIFNFSDMALYNALNRAFEAERANSVSAMKNKTQMTYTFEDNKGVSTYTLVRNDGQFVLIMKWVSSENKDNDTSYDISTDPELVKGLKELAQFDVENGDDYTYYNFKKGTIVVNSNSENAHNVNYNFSEARSQAAAARKQAAAARKQAAEARKQAAAARKQALAQAAAARKEALAQAAEARKVALSQAAEARKQALAQAAEARRQAAEARKEAIKEAKKARKDALKAAEKARKAAQKARKNNKNSTIRIVDDEDDNSVIIYQL